MLFRGGILLVIEVMNQANDSPALFVLTELTSVGTHARFYRESMFSQAF